MTSVIKANRFVILYLFSVVSLLFVVYVIPSFLNYNFDSWADFYRTLGKLLGIWGVIFGIAVIFFTIVSMIIFLGNSSSHALQIRLSRIELVLIGLFLINIIGFFTGLLRGESLTYVLGDTLKGSFIPLFYIWAKRNLDSTEKLASFTKMVLIIESVIFIIFAITSYIPFAQSTRTFLYTIAFTLYFEEKRIAYKLLFFLVTLFALYIVMITGAFRGTVIIFALIVILNIMLNTNRSFSPLPIIAILSAFFIIFLIVNIYEISFDKNISKVSKRFESTIGKSSSKNFGLEESAFQRVGETIDVFRAFQLNNPIHVLIGFGNGATLNNVLMTPSEFLVYKTKLKHNIYVTLVGVLFRYGVIGLMLYFYLFYYIIKSLFFYYKNRLNIPLKREYVYLKVLVLYHFSTIVYSFVAYLFVGNIVIAFTLPLHILLKEKMSLEISHGDTNIAVV